MPGYVGFVSQKFSEFLNLVAEQIGRVRYLAPRKVTEALETIQTLRGMADEKFAQVATEIQTRIMRGLSRFATRAHAVLPSQNIVVRRAVQAVVEAGPYTSWQRTMTRERAEAVETAARDLDSSAAQAMAGIASARKRWAQELLEDPSLPDNIRKLAESKPDLFLDKLGTFGSKPSYVEFTPGQKIYRVVEDENGYRGGFWSPERPPETEDAWRSRDAVRNDWNAGGAYIVAEVPPPPAALIGTIGPQVSKYDDAKYLPGGGTQIWVPQFPAVSSGQVKEFWHTNWNAPTSALRVMRNAGKIDECDL